MFSFEGSDFVVPYAYKKGRDERDNNDVAWMDIKDYYDRKVSQGEELNWKLIDLPKQYFETCSISRKDGKLPGTFHLCGNCNLLSTM